MILVCLILATVLSFNCTCSRASHDSPDFNEYNDLDMSGLYEFNGLSVVKQCGAQSWEMAIMSVEVSPEGYMKFNVSWTATVVQNKPGYTVYLTKYSDVGDPNMYITDNLGNRYDHIRLGGAAARDVHFSNRQTAYGWYAFPPAKDGATSFTFHDDDDPPIEITDIVLRAEQAEPLYDNSSQIEAVSGTLGGTGDDEGQQVCQTEDGGWIVIGYTNSYNSNEITPWLIKFNAEGVREWDWLYNIGEWAKGMAVQQTSDGGYVMAGTVDGTGPVSIAAWILKTDSQGKEIWRKVFGQTLGYSDMSVCQTQDDDYIVSYRSNYSDSCWLLRLDSEGNEKWHREFKYSNSEDLSFSSVKQAIDGDFIVGGILQDYPYRAYLIKIDAAGNKLWERVYGTSKTNMRKIFDLQVTADGGYVLVGQSDGHNIWIAKVNGEGVILWENSIDKGGG